MHDNTLSPHRRELLTPEEVPSGVIAGIWNSSIEPYLGQLPYLSLANLLGEGRHVVVGVGITERFASSVKQVLAIHEDDCTLGWRLAQRLIGNK